MPVRNRVRRILKLLNKLVVSDNPEIPRLPVKPLRTPTVNRAVCQIFIRVTSRLFTIRGPSPPVFKENPEEADRVNVGSSLILKVLK